MRRTEDTPFDPEIAAQLDAIDATLAGDPVDPQYAELAELALLLRAERPSVSTEFAGSLDRRVATRFAPPAAPAPGDASSEPGGLRQMLRGGWMTPLAGLAAGCVAVVVAVVVLASVGGGSGGGVHGSTSVSPFKSPRPTSSGSQTSAASSASSSGSSGSSGSSSGAASSGAGSSAGAQRSISSQAASPPAPANGAAASGSVTATASAPAPAPNGRKIVQSAQLALGAAPAHIDDVAQEVFDVAGREHAVVNNSNVTAGAGGYAQFQLSVPSSSLQDTMTALSQMRYATVTSRTDSTQDVNGQYLSDNRKLGDDRALRASLLKQLANATTQAQIDSLKARIHDSEAAIGRDESTLRNLNHKIDFSQVTVTINGATVAPGHSGGHSGSGFTLGKAAHDAGRVLTVAAGVALITLAVLTPLALVGALLWWIASSVRRRRREQALDMA
jgi:hypothetical protein